MQVFGITKDNYYKVGHAAILLIDDHGQVHYADFGRYHAPEGMGRVRTAYTDHDLSVQTKAFLKPDGSIHNINDILTEVAANASTHGDGQLVAAGVRVDFPKAMARIETLQNAPFIPYGPFVRKGTNCARFVADVLLAGQPSPSVSLTIRLAGLPSPHPGFLMKAIGPYKIIHPEYAMETRLMKD